MKTASKEMNDEAMVATPDLWPQWPLLPLKHRHEKNGGWPVLGVMFASEPLTVFLGNMFAGIDIMNAPSKKFATVQELVAEWMVD